MPVNLRGKQYATVAERITALHAATNGQYTVVTEIVRWEDEIVVMRATLTIENGALSYGDIKVEVHNEDDDETTQTDEVNA